MTLRAVALMCAERNDLDAAQKQQDNLRAFAERTSVEIMSFLACENKATHAIIQHAFALCQKHEASMLIIDQLATMSVPIKDLAQTFSKVTEQRLTLAFARESLLLPPEMVSAVDVMMKSSFICEHEARSDKIKKSLKAIKQKGKKLGGKSFGMTSHQMTIIKQILKLYNDGFSLQKICNLLVSNNIKTTTNKNWHPTTVKRIIDRHKKHLS